MVADHQGHRRQGGVIIRRNDDESILDCGPRWRLRWRVPQVPCARRRSFHRSRLPGGGLAPGGPTDTSARVLAEKMKDTLGQSVIVENQAGAGGTIALIRVARADPDGHTLYLGNWTVNVGSITMYPFPYDVLNDFEPIALLTTAKMWIVARKDLPANTAKEFVDWLKANPGKANAASVGVGSAAHVACST